MKHLLTFLVMSAFAMLLSCTGTNTPRQQEVSPAADTPLASLPETPLEEGDIVVYTRYKLPLPVELYRFLKTEESLFDKELMNRPDNMSSYNTNAVQAMNLGIYAADLAYCTVFEQNQLSLIYFDVTQKMAEALHVGKGYDRQLIERVNNNLNNSDSLYQIATRSYWNACNSLEAEGQINILPFVVTGGWIESMYLATHSQDFGSPNEDIMKKIAMQQTALNNLMQYLYEVMMDSNTFLVNEEVQELGFKFRPLRDIYDKLGEKPEENITEAEFKAIAHEIRLIRNAYTE